MFQTKLPAIFLEGFAPSAWWGVAPPACLELDQERDFWEFKWESLISGLVKPPILRFGVRRERLSFRSRQAAPLNETQKTNMDRVMLAENKHEHGSNSKLNIA